MKKKPAQRRANVIDTSYDADSRSLTVTFHNGQRYRYTDVDPEIAGGLDDCDSKGGYLHKHIIGRCDGRCIDHD